MFGKKNKNIVRKKGILFTLDAIFAAIIIVTALTILSNNFIHDEKNSDISYLSYDIIKSFSNIKTSELNNPYLKQLISSGIVNNTNNTIIETIGELYVLNKTNEARILAHNISAEIIPSRYGFAIVVNDEIVYSNEKSVNSAMISAKRLISGIEKFKPIKGSSSKVYLQGVSEKRDSSYIFFGGFIGQGNISAFTEDIPSDANMTGIYFESDIGDKVGDSFNIFINGKKCLVNFTKTSPNMYSNSWNISACKSNITPGAKNNVSISFIPSTDYNIAYLSGGFFRFEYTTHQMYKNEETGYKKEFLPSIDGYINIYSSSYVPGDINNINIQLKYFVNHTNSSNSTFYMKIGNTTVIYDSSSTSVQTIQLDGSVLEEYGLNYSVLSKKNIPIRIGAENVTYFAEYLGIADAILITDVSGSMNWKMDTDNSNGGARDCDDPDFNSSDTQRLSVAKCLDNNFASDMLNISGNLIGLISYEDSTETSETVNLTDNLTKIENMVDSYNANGQTCICCGINSGKQMLNKSLLVTTLISNNSNWLFNNFTFRGNISNDSMNRMWFEREFNDSLWTSKNAVLGAMNNYSYSPIINNEIGYSLNGSRFHVNLWEQSGDTPGAPNDFTSGVLNSTANTYGILGNDDGWDYDTENNSGPFGFDDDIDYNGIVNGKLSMDSEQGNQNSCTNRDCSGAYGIKINITDEMFNIINSSGKAVLSFWYEWDDVSNNPFENDDQVWVKARITRPGGESFYLGENLDTDHVGGDSDFEIDTRDNPNLDFSGDYLFDIAKYINSSGFYYLEFGGKINASNSNEYGTWRFDNISFLITNATDHYYFRKKFNITDLTKVRKGVLNVLSDDRAIVYVNSNLVDYDSLLHDGKMWNRNGINIEGSYFKAGENIIAVELMNLEKASKFDLELLGINDSRTKAMIVMTDGVSNQECSEQNTGDATEDAIKAACMASQDYGIKVYSVGFSTESDQYTVEEIAKCGNGLSLRSSDINKLKEFYKDIAAEIMDVARVEQKIVIQGSPTISKLFGDESYIEINYTPPVQSPEYDEISVNFEDKISENCTFFENISSKVRIKDAKVSSYSSSKWTDFVYVNNEAVHNLSFFNYDYQFLGDPFIVGFSPVLLHPSAADNISIRTGIDPYNSTGCSPNNTFFYTALMKASISYSKILEKAEGCNWSLEFEDGVKTNLNVPPNYNGVKKCSYNSTSFSYDANDTYDDAMFKLMSNLDLDNDGKIDVNLINNNLVVNAISVQRVPYPWGPAIAEVRVWQ